MKFRIIREFLLFVLLYTYSVEALRLPCGNQTHCRIGTENNNDKPSDLRIRVLDEVVDINTHVREKTDQLLLENKIYDDEKREEVSTSTSFFKSFADDCEDTGDFEWKPSFNMGLKQLTGCTVLLIVSKHEVYAAHFFEDVSMADILSTDDAARASNLISTFKEETDFEDLGEYAPGMSNNPTSSEGPGSDIPHVWLISPLEGKEPPVDFDEDAEPDRRPSSEMGFLASFQYEEELTNIENTLRHYWPGIQPIQRVEYEPLNKLNDDPSLMGPGNTDKPDSIRLRDDANGRLLIEYDNTNGQYMLRIWFEQTQIFLGSLS